MGNKILLFVVILSFIPSVSAQELTAESKVLSGCEVIYSYYAHYMQIQNNEGATKNLLVRYSRVAAANFFLNLEDGVLKEARQALIREEQSGIKNTLDSDPAKSFSKVDECDVITLPIIRRVALSGIKFDGKSFLDFQAIIIESLRKVMGLQ